MMGVVKTVKRIQVNKIAGHSHLFKNIIYKETHPTEHDESDDLELMKKEIQLIGVNAAGLPIKVSLIRDTLGSKSKWGDTTITME